MKFEMQSYPEKGRGIMKKWHIILGVILLIGLFVFIPNGAATDPQYEDPRYEDPQYEKVAKYQKISQSLKISEIYETVDPEGFGSNGDFTVATTPFPHIKILSPKEVDACGNGTCETDKGESCANCPSDCPCGQGKICDPSDSNADVWGCVATLPQIKILSPKEGEIIWVDPGDQGIHITVTAKVTDPDNNLRIAEVEYMGPEGAQVDNLNLNSAGGTGKGTVVLPGKGKYKLTVWAADEQNGRTTKSVNIEIRESITSQIQDLKVLEEIIKKTIEGAKEKAKALKDSPMSDAEFFDEMEKIDKEIDELVAWIEETNKYTDDVKPKKVIEEHKTETKKLKMELRVAKSIKEVYSDKYAKSVIEIQRLKGIIKTKDNEMKIMRLSDGKSSLQLILSEKTECEFEPLREDSLWVKVKDGVVGSFESLADTASNILHYTDPFHILELPNLIDIVVYTYNAVVTSDHTKFETSYDPASKITTVTVFEDYVTVKSLKTNDPEMIVSAGQRIEITDDGFSPKLELTQDDLMCLADRYTVAFGGINPLLISTNNPPTASFYIMPENPQTSDTIVVASTSSDPDGDTLTYSWYRDGSEIGNSPNWEWENPQAGEYNIKLVVDDGKGGSDECSTKIMVIGPTVIPGFEIGIGTGDKTNNPPIASFIMPQNPKTSDTIVVASTSFDPDDDKLTYSWYRDGIYLTEIGDWSDWEWENPQAGEHTIKLVVDDGKGRSDECSTKIMVIGPTPTGIPGFEIALLIGAIVVALIIIKRRKHNL